MSKKKTQIKTSKEYTDEEIIEIIKQLFDFLYEKPEHIFVKDFLILEKKMLSSDIDILKKTNPIFETAFNDAMQIEETKLKKFGAADRLNASFVKEILNRDHN